MFRGVTPIHLDDKGRIAVPARYRERLQAVCASRLVITVDPDRCLLVYPEPVWLTIEAKLKALPSLNPTVRNLQRLYIGYAHEGEMDGQGRVLLPPYLRSFAKLNKRAVLLGQGDKFELWDEDTWNQRFDRWLDETDFSALKLPAEAENLSL